MEIRKARRGKKKLRMALVGVPGAGKTFSALAIASGMATKILLIDTENGSSELYADKFDFDVLPLDQYHPNKFIEAIIEGGRLGYEAIIIDSLSHAWYEMLELAGGKFDGWAKVKPLERKLMDSMLHSPSHIFASMRSKSEYVMEDYQHQGKTKVKPVKVGTSAVQAQGIEYEFDIAGDLDLSHLFSITKSRCEQLTDTRWLKPGKELADILTAWLSEGVDVVLPRSPAQKNADFKQKREELGVDVKVAIEILSRFSAKTPADLTESQLTQAIAMLETEAIFLDTLKIGAVPFEFGIELLREYYAKLFADLTEEQQDHVIDLIEKKATDLSIDPYNKGNPDSDDIDLPDIDATDIPVGD